jgi:hypothetical protein
MKSKTSFFFALGLGIFAANPLNAQSFAIDWFTIDGGGGISTGTNFSLQGTIGQPDAGLLSSANFELQGGFWSMVVSDGEGSRLAIARDASGAVTISWPRTAANFVLDWSGSLSSASGAWSQVGFPYQTNETHIFIRLPTPSANGFFRLRK